MAAASIGKRLASAITRRWETTRSLQQLLVNHCIAGQHAAAAEKSKCFVPHRRCYSDRAPLHVPIGYHLFDLAVDKAIQHYNDHIKVEEEDGPSTMIYPSRRVSKEIRCATIIQIILKIGGGQKYVSIFVAPYMWDAEASKLDDEPLKLLSFTKVDRYVPSPITKFVGRIRWAVSPRNDPLITAVAHFALAQHNKEEKLTHLIRATTQMVGEYEIFRMTFKGEFSGESSKYGAIALVPRINPEKMELVEFEINEYWNMYGRRGSYLPHRYQYEKDEKYEYEYEDDKRLVDDPRVIAAARFALSQYNETDRVRLDDTQDRVRRVVEATRRTYSGDEILTMEFEGEMDGSWFYDAIVLVPVNDPENMRLAYCARNYDDPDHTDEHVCEFDVDEHGFHEYSIVDPRVVEAARLALAAYDRKDKLVRVIEASCRVFPGDVIYFIVKFVGENDPLRTYLAMVSASLKYGPLNMQLKRVFTKVCESQVV